MKLAIAVETSAQPKNPQDYRVWYLEVNSGGQVVNVGVKAREELVKDLFENYKKSGKSEWRTFLKGAEKSVGIEPFDFISMNVHENTHFGNLPTIAEFQTVLDVLQTNLEIRSIA